MESLRADEWLTVTLERDGGLLSEHGLLKANLNQLSHGDQFPSVIALFGASCNTTLADALQGGPPQKPGPGIYLKLDAGTARSEVPVLYANCSLDHCSPPADDGFRSDCRRHQITWYGNNLILAEDVVDWVYSNLIVPFSDVLCFLSNSLPAAINDARRYLRWIERVHPHPQPRAIFVFTDIVTTACGEFRQRVERIRHTLGQVIGTSIAIACLPESTLSRPAVIAKSLTTFQALLSQQMKLAHTARDRASMRFNSDHFTALFGLACQRFAAVGSPFDFIQASRITRPVPVAMKLHIARFLQAAAVNDDLTFVAPVIASALMMNSCPPRMHRFSGHAIFNSLYRAHVIAAYHEAAKHNDLEMLLPHLLLSIEQHLDQYLRQLSRRYLVPSALHLENLAGFKTRWTRISCDTSCFTCLLRMPEHVLHAGHAICSECVRILGTPVDDDPYRRNIARCPLCQVRLQPGPHHISMHPPTAGDRVLTMDGGGVRGIMELELLQLLEEKLQFPIRHGFDMMVGTSTGGLIALGLGVNGWSVARCTEQFETLLGQAFWRRAASNVPVLGSLLEFVLAYLTDSFYDSTKFAEALISAFGQDKLLGKGIDEGMKVAVIATNTNSFPCTLANYNGPNERSVNRGYANLHGNVMVHEAARSTSAAPFYHTAITLSSVWTSSEPSNHTITLQDGAVSGMNNPGALALRESQSLHPSSRKPDLFVSVGTNELEQAPPDSHRGWLDRLRVACRRGLDCQKAWNEQFSQLKEQHHDSFHRLALEFAHDAPFDDVSVVAELKQAVRARFTGSSEVQDTAAAIDAKCFFFELAAVPVPHGTHRKCTGAILCRLAAGSPELRSLVSRLCSHGAQFTLGPHRLGSIDDIVVSRTTRGERFVLGVEFVVLNLQEQVSICMTGENGRAIAVSSFPQSIAWFVERQELGEVFGRTDHTAVGPRKRKAGWNVGAGAQKRRG